MDRPLALDGRNLDTHEISPTLQSKQAGGYSLNYTPMVMDRQLAAPLVARQAKGAFTDPVNDNIIAFSSKDSGGDAAEDIAPTLRAQNFDKSHINGGGQIAICHGFQSSQSGVRTSDVHATLDSNNGSRRHNGVFSSELHHARRLTPTECERLQGFPDGWTAGQSDSVRYRQLGNAVAVPVAEWIGRRVAAYLSSEAL
jgi:DNA (cytosine-5)-methyltransferase 1